MGWHSQGTILGDRRPEGGIQRLTPLMRIGQRQQPVAALNHSQSGFHPAPSFQIGVRQALRG
jgi:hypothetical protein